MKWSEIAAGIKPFVLRWIADANDSVSSAVNVVRSVVVEGPGIDVTSDATVGLGGDTILLYKANGNPVAEYATLAAAAAAAGSGDTIVLPSQTIALTAGVTLPAGVALVGMGDKSIISASGFSGTAITLAADAMCRSFALAFVSNGTTAIGIDARFARAKIIDVTVMVSGGSASNVAVEMGVSGDGPGTLEALTTMCAPPVTVVDAAITYGPGSGEFYSEGDHYAGLHVYTTCTFRVTHAAILSGRTVRVTLENTGSNGFRAGLSEPYYEYLAACASAMTEGTAFQSVPIGTSVTVTGLAGDIVGGGVGEICVRLDNNGSDLPAVSCKVMDVEIFDGANWISIWAPGANLQDAPQVVLCKLTAAGTGADALVCDAGTAGVALHNVLSGSVYDVNAAGSHYLYGNQYDHAKVGGLPIQEAGDRSAWDVADYASNHASDIAATNYVFHTPPGAAVGDMPYWNGTKWVLLTDVAAGQPLMSGGVGTAPAYAGWTLVATVGQTYTFPTTAGTVVLGTGTQYQLATWTGTNFVSGLGALGTLNAVLQSGGAGAYPVWSAGTIVFGGASCSLTLPNAAVSITGGGTLAMTAGQTNDFASPVGVGVVPSYRLHVLETFAGTYGASDSLKGAWFQTDYTSASALTTGNICGPMFQTNYNSNAHLFKLYGAFFEAYHNGTGRVDNLYGAVYEPANHSSGTLGTIQGFITQPLHSGTGLVDALYGFQANPVVSSTGNVTLISGFVVAFTATAATTIGTSVCGIIGTPSLSGGAAVSGSHYGLFIQDQRGIGAASYALYSVGGNVVFDNGDVSVGGGITIVGTGKRFYGDFSNATQANRLLFQSSTVNGNTAVGVIPNGTATQGAFSTYNASDLTGAYALGQLRTNATAVDINSTYGNAGTQLPITFSIASAAKMTINTTGTIGLVSKIATYDNVATEGYGVPAIVDDVAAAYNVDVTATNFTNAGTAGDYEVSIYLVPSMPDVTAGTVTLTLLWNDGYAAQAAAIVASSLIAVTNFASAHYRVHLGSGYVQWKTTHTGAYNSAYYAIYMTCKRVN